MKQTTFNYIKAILKDYPKIDRYIEEREKELRYPYRPNDVNSDIKGMGKDPDSMGLMMITIEQDRRLRSLERNKEVVEKLLVKCDEDTRIIVEELYMRQFPKYTLTGLVENHIVSCSRNTASKKRSALFHEIAKELNLDI